MACVPGGRRPIEPWGTRGGSPIADQHNRRRSHHAARRDDRTRWRYVPALGARGAAGLRADRRRAPRTPSRRDSCLHPMMRWSDLGDGSWGAFVADLDEGAAVSLLGGRFRQHRLQARSARARTEHRAGLSGLRLSGARSGILSLARWRLPRARVSRSDPVSAPYRRVLRRRRARARQAAWRRQIPRPAGSRGLPARSRDQRCTVAADPGIPQPDQPRLQRPRSVFPRDGLSCRR